MAQHDYIIDNATGASVRADLNNALLAIAGLNSGGTAPTTTYAYMPWADTSTGLLKLRNAANTNWVTVGTLASPYLGLVNAPTGAGTNRQALITDGAGTQSWANRVESAYATAQTLTSGTNVDFLSIPSWATRIQILIAGVTAAGISNLQLRVGTSSGFITTGYLSGAFTPTTSVANSATGLILTASRAATTVLHGTVELNLVASNQWVMSAALATSDVAGASTAAGSISVGGVLDRVRLTTVSGDAFSAGVVNIKYEG